MRQQLITCLTDEVAPEIRRLRDPEAAILKVANQHNFAPAQVEMLAQIYNTAKTIRFLEKAASRGDSFPIIDVPALVSKYINSPPEGTNVKAARARSGRSAYDQLSDDPSTGLPACFAGINKSLLTVEPESSYEEKAVSVKFASHQQSRLRAEVEAMGVIREEYRDKARDEMLKIAQALKHSAFYDHTPYTFADLDQDALYIYGEPVRPLLDKLATFVAAEHVKVARADGPGPLRLVHDAKGFMAKLATLDETMSMVAAAEDFIKESGVATLEPPKKQKAAPAKPDEHKGAPKDKGGEKPDSAPESAGNNPGGGPSGARKSPSAGGGKPSGGGGGQDFFGSLAGAAQKAYAPIETLKAKAKGVMGNGMAGQQQVDQSHMDARHLAVLHNLLATDEVLADADPDRVIDLYNSIRENSPQMAADVNIMRVTLRSMIQHDGVSPFDMKQLLDTENARQKVDFNQGLADSIRYGGKELAAPNKPM